MKEKQRTRYERPSVEIEFDQGALTRAGCCRFVPIVLRMCGVADNAMLTVMFERARPLSADAERCTDDYHVHPNYDAFRVALPQGEVKGYREYQCALLARPHAQETGTIRITLESRASNVLTEASIRLDSREGKPVFSLAKGKLKDLRFLPRLRLQAERDALHGHFPVSAHVKELPAEERNKEHMEDVHQTTLFPM